MNFTREMYKNIKKYDRQQMENFCKSIYAKGFDDGVAAANNADFKIKLVQVLDKTKGIGDKTRDKILNTLRTFED